MSRKSKKDTKKEHIWQKGLLVHAEKVHKSNRNPTIYLKGFLFVLVFILAFRLVQLQVVEGAIHLKRAEENRLVTRRIAASRGIVRDRNGEVLTRNVPTYKKLAEGATAYQAKFEPISKEEALNMHTQGQMVFFDISRDYLYGEVMAPILGYIREADEEDLDSLGPSYFPGDLVGKSGVEKTFETYLRGTPGIEYIEISSNGDIQRTVGQTSPTVGRDLVLSIDINLQKIIYEAMADYTGAAVAIDPQTGHVQALVSKPTFDPNNILESLDKEGLPFFNRAIGGGYPPGSIYKPITLTAGLEEGKVTPEDTYEDTGEILVNGFRFGNWLFDRTGGTEGLVDARKALQRSNDIYFYRLGEEVGPSLLAEWSKLFGLGSPTGIELPGEISGLVPDPIWKESVIGEKWYLGNTYHMAIGQGDLHVTPLQMAVATAAIANGGRLCAPTLVQDVTPKCKELGISTETITVIKEGMEQVCQPGGTASRWSSFEPKVACKTGTAQFGGPNSTDTHAWFSVFAPVDNPELVLVVLLEGAGEGSEHASPVALEVFNKWFSR